MLYVNNCLIKLYLYSIILFYKLRYFKRIYVSLHVSISLSSFTQKHLDAFYKIKTALIFFIVFC